MPHSSIFDSVAKILAETLKGVGLSVLDIQGPVAKTEGELFGCPLMIEIWLMPEPGKPWDDGPQNLSIFFSFADEAVGAAYPMSLGISDEEKHRHIVAETGRAIHGVEALLNSAVPRVVVKNNNGMPTTTSEIDASAIFRKVQVNLPASVELIATATRDQARRWQTAVFPLQSAEIEFRVTGVTELWNSEVKLDLTFESS